MSRPTLVVQDAKALRHIKQGVDAIYEPVRRTFGPQAGTTLMYRTYNRGPRNVDDGYYTAEVVVPKNPFVRLVAEFFKEGIKRTNEKVGDGTTGTGIVAGVLFNEIYLKSNERIEGFVGSAAKQTSMSFMDYKRLILAEAKVVKEKVRAASRPIESLEDLERIAAISLGEDGELSKTIAKMAHTVGRDGFIDVVEGYKGEVETELIQGLRFPAKIANKAFVNKKERYEMVVEETPVFITNYKIDQSNEGAIQKVLTACGGNVLTIIAPDIAEAVLIKIAMGHKEGVKIWPVKAPGLRTEQMEDIAAYCGAVLVNKDAGMKLSNVAGGELGFLGKLIVKDVENREDAVALGGRGKPEVIEARIKELQGQLEETKDVPFKKLLERRIASLASGGGVIRVGSPTDAESLPLKLKIEDVVFACRAALRSGYVCGGGICLKEIAEELPNDHILKAALLAPHKQLVENAGGAIDFNPDEVIDPTDAIYYAVEHATSVVASLITVKNLVVEEPELDPEQGMMKVAEAIHEFVISFKRQQGMITDSQIEAERDRFGGLTEDEYVQSDNG